jgi:beta-glucosidase
VAASPFNAVSNRLFTGAVFDGRYPDDVLAMIERYGVEDQIDLDELASAVEPIDYLGVNYYNVNHVEHVSGVEPMGPWPGAWDARIARPPGQLTEMGWGVEPEGLLWMLERVGREHPGLPLYICENGAAYQDVVLPDGSVDDPLRIAYLEGHIEAVHTAITRGVQVDGYFVWSLLDNFEWARGYEKRFGIVRVDLETMERTIKGSGHWYRDFISGRIATS